MRVEESFVVTEPPQKLWEFFEDVERVARCVPGVDSVEQIDGEHSKLRVTQAVGPMRATFDLSMRITERQPVALMRFTATGRAVRGAAGNVRSVSSVHLEPVDGGTRVSLESDVALGGVLGSVGQKVVAKQAAQVTRSFSESLERALKGQAVGPAPSVAPPTGMPAESPTPTPGGRRAAAGGGGTGVALPGFKVGFGAGLGFGAGAGLAALAVLAVRRLTGL